MRLVHRNLAIGLLVAGLGCLAIATLVPVLRAENGGPAGTGSVNFAIGIDTNGDSTDDCDTNASTGAGTKCTISTGAPFSASIYLLDNGGFSYMAFDSSWTFSGVGFKQSQTYSWPDCVVQAQLYGSGTALVGCTIFSGTPSTYTGRLVALDFNCTATGTVAIVHGNTNTNISEHPEAASGSETLTINCNAPTNTPAATGTNTPTSPPTSTRTNTPTNTPTRTPTFTPTNTPTNTPTRTPTFTPTNTPTNTRTFTPTNSPTNTPTRTPTGTLPPTATPTPCAPAGCPTATFTATHTATPTPTATATATNTFALTNTATATFTNTPATATAAATNTFAPSVTATPTTPPTVAAMNTATRTATATRTPTRTRTPLAKACGDVNDDGQVDSVDALLVLQFQAGLIARLPNAASADVTRDGLVNSIDALLVLQNQAGLIPQLDCAGAAGADERAPAWWKAWRDVHRGFRHR